jgi:hypothetical protein
VSQAGDVSHRLTHVALKETPLSDDEIETQITMEQNVSISLHGEGQPVLSLV